MLSLVGIAFAVIGVSMLYGAFALLRIVLERLVYHFELQKQEHQARYRGSWPPSSRSSPSL
jgi:hypothetical protein